MNSFNALILKKRIYKDSDLVLTILSEQNEKIELLAVCYLLFVAFCLSLSLAQMLFSQVC